MTFAVLGPDAFSDPIAKAVEESGHNAVRDRGLHLLHQDKVSDWFRSVDPAVIFVVVPGLPERTSSELVCNTLGVINLVLMAAEFKRVIRIFSLFGSNSVYLLKRLCLMLSIEQGIDAALCQVRGYSKLAGAAVLAINDVLAKETDKGSEKDQDKG